MKLVVLAAGKGTRLNTAQTNKCLVKIAGKTLLEHNLDLCLDIKAEEIILVVGYNASYVKQFVGDNYKGISVRYVTQEPQLGIAHAIKLCAPDLTGSFLMCLSDELLTKPKIVAMKEFFESHGADCVCGMVKDSEERIHTAYTMNLNDKAQILYLLEKPDFAFNEYKGTGYCMFSKSMLLLLETLKKNSKRNEYEMGDWIQYAVSKAYQCYGYICGERDFNINTNADLIEAENYVRRKTNDFSEFDYALSQKQSDASIYDIIIDEGNT